eukprot:gi/632941108/ref/XP_007885687.1/ PREDICTED: uncharacterized protein LOC103174894 [Callorhinchus milii]
MVLLLLVLLVVTWPPLSVEDVLNVLMDSGPVRVAVNKDTLLKCQVPGYESRTIDLASVSVEWYFSKPPDVTRKLVYKFVNSAHTPHRKGAKISDDKLKKGIASLFLLSVGFQDEGQYECVVFITPDSGRGNAEMFVSAEPKVSVDQSSIIIENGTEKSIMCNINRYYPLKIDVKWIHNSGDGKQEVLKSVCRKSPVKNEDGTFNLSSRLTLRPDLTDSGKTYTCLVNHRTLVGGLSKDVLLTVKEKDIVIPVGRIVTSVFITVLLCALILGGAFYAYLRIKKVPPKVTNITKPAHFLHHQEAFLDCEISGYRPDGINIEWLLQRRESNTVTIYKWSDKESTEDVKSLLLSDSETLDQTFNIVSSIEQHSDGTSSVTCHVKLLLDIFKDDKAILTLHVRHDSTESFFSESVTLNVEGVPPMLTDIVMPPRVIHQEVLALTCPINGFKPRPLAISWYKRHNNEEVEIVKVEPGKLSETVGNEIERPKYVHNLNELRYEDGTYSITSILKFIPTIIEDNNSQYICKITHPATSITRTKEVSLTVKALPNFDDIILHPKSPIADEILIATCRVHSFFPRNIIIVWRKDDEILAEMIPDAEVTIGKDNLFYFKSRLEFVVVREDFGKHLYCEMRSDSPGECRRAECSLIPMVASPIIEYLKSEPPFPEPGKEATIQIRVHKYFPKDVVFLWFKNNERVEEANIQSIEPQGNIETGLYYRESTWKLFINPEDHGAEIKIEVLHFPTSHTPIKAFLTLHLGGIPKISDIEFDSNEPSYGQPLVIRCCVTNFSPKEIVTTWLQGKTTISEGVRNIGPEKDENGYFQLTSFLTMTPTALDHNTTVSFLVKHKALQEPIQRDILLLLPASAPTVSEMQCNPTIPEVNKQTTFSVSLSDYAPEEIEVKWFKGKVPYTGPVTNTKAQIAENGLFASVTKIEFAPDPSDQNTDLRCEVTHPESTAVKEIKYQISS